MGIFNSINNTSNKAVRIGEHFLKTSQDYYTLKAFQQIAYSFSLLSKIMIVGSLALLGLVFVTIAGALALGEYLGSTPLGCLLVGALLLLLGCIVYLLRKNIDRKIIRKMSNNFFD
ncbi:hypothetical protein [Abyssalbus ytuae]|uniref:Phage holin family protein n=1 Tax=Abyssalbus ytuae TaxID=2926907 RepID=A0A9E7D2I4_9FLAO|nr:hypothetical protein [Abyssalbus ytuae]UOB16719.1 hypothetical protein MQE35_13350 [Abyssalbus ytuae]